MKRVLKVQFNNAELGEFCIENPGYYPRHGEIFNCNWSDFIDDKERIKKLKEMEETDCWMVERFACSYSKEEVVCQIVLYPSADFEKEVIMG